MPRSVAHQLEDVKVQPLAMELASRSENRTTDPDEDLARQEAGRIFAGMVKESDLTRQEVTAIFRYTDQSIVTKFESGEKLPMFFVRLVTNADLLRGLIVAGAKAPGDNIHARTVIDIEDERKGA